MANVAGSAATGPVSKDAVSGGKKFPLKKQDSTGGSYSLSNSSEEARRTIMSMRVQSTGFNGGVESAIKGQKAPR